MPSPDPRVYRRFVARVPLELGVGGRVHAVETEDVSQGGCRVVLPVALAKGATVQVRLRAPQLAIEAGGDASVAWASREPPYRIGLRFSEALAGQMAPYLRALLGPVPLRNRED